MSGLHLLEHLDFTPEGVYLTVAPRGEATPLSPTELENGLKILSLTDIDWKGVRAALQAKEERHLIAPPQEVPSRDGEVTVTLSPDEMEAYLTLYPPINGKPVTAEAARQALENQGVVYGIDPALLEKAIQEGNPGERYLVARGKPARDGRDAVIRYNFPMETLLKPAELADGRVDYYNLNMVHNIEEGQVLATKTPATPGEPGYTVRGKRLLPRPGRELPLRGGENTRLSDDGCSLVATGSGHVVLQDGRIQVYTSYYVQGDVDFSTGNIQFVGSVRIAGGIKTGFTVKAEGDVEVGQTIEGGSIYAGGNVIVKEGIRGLGKGSIKAGGSVFARFLENASIQAGKHVIVAEAIMHSRVKAGGKIIVNGRKGSLVGGIYRAGEAIEAKTIGSSLATATELDVGVDPEQREAYNRNLAEREQLEGKLDQVEKALQLMNRLVAAGKALPPDKQELFSQLQVAREQLSTRLTAVIRERAQLQQNLSHPEGSWVKAGGVIHPGVTIKMGNLVYEVPDTMHSVLFTVQDGEIRGVPCSQGKAER